MTARRDLADRIACHGLRGLGAEGTLGGSQRPQEALPRPERPPEHLGGTTGAQKPAVDARGPVFDAMSEAEFQRHVEQGLKDRGYLFWHVRDPRLMRAGLPDVIAVHPTKLPRRVIFFELKKVGGRLSKKQAEALAALSDIYGVDARTIRPPDWPTILEELDR